MQISNRKITLAARPAGFPRESDFALERETSGDLAQGHILIEGRYLSLDPYMRGRMSDLPSYAEPVKIGETMPGGVVGAVVESRHPNFEPGEIVEGMLGWQEYAVSDGTGLRKIDPSIAPVSTALGILGMPGVTAYFGLLEVGQVKAGETVVVSGAAGAVGTVVGQIAKIIGCRVVGITGGDDKIAYLVNELGFDAAFNYKARADYRAALAELCPNGIDVYFDNVGGEISDAAFKLLNIHARVPVCGQSALYNLKETPVGPRLLTTLIIKRARVEGFLVFDYADRFQEAVLQLARWLREGKLKYRENVVMGIENAPKAFLGMLRGEHTGKQLVQLSTNPGISRKPR